jgi:hypothetical protein
LELSEKTLHSKEAVRELFAESGLDDDEGWEMLGILLEAVRKFSSEIFLAVNLELQRDPFVGQLGHKWLVLNGAATEVLAGWERLSVESSAAFLRR